MTFPVIRDRMQNDDGKAEKTADDRRITEIIRKNTRKSQKLMKTGYSIRTWRMRLVCPEPIWLDRTEEYFQNVVEFYYHLLRQHEELWNSSLFDIQRSLELLTLAGRDGRQPTNPLPMGKVPVYLRRAAINKASATVKSTQELPIRIP